MDTISGSRLARELGTSVPRVVRAVERLGIDARSQNGRLDLTPPQARQMRRELGVLPEAPGLTRSQTAALAALRSAPFGLVSARAVALRAGLSPTAASRALSSLLERGLVSHNEEVIAAGRARELAIWRANVGHPRWRRIDPVLDQVESPTRERPLVRRVPRRLRHLFWNTAPSQLEIERSGSYIARRLLQTMDLQGLAWGAQTIQAEDWQKAARGRGLSEPVRALGSNLAQVDYSDQGTLKGLFDKTKLEVFDASKIKQLEPPTEVAGLRIASLPDLMAMKLKVMSERGELRDYFDVKAIDEQSSVSVEEGIEHFVRRYDAGAAALQALVLAMGHFDDVEDDEALPISKDELEAWWRKRQPGVIRNSNRFE